MSLEFSEDELKNEVWKDIPGYEGYYQASDLGRLRSLDKPVRVNLKGDFYIKKGRILKLCKSKAGYFIINLSVDGKHRTWPVHALVMLTFRNIKNSPANQVNHIDGEKLNNKLINLEMTSPLENTTHAIKLGLMDNKGSNHGNSKLKETDVLKIREMFFNGFSYKDISIIFSVCRRTVRNVVNKTSWKHV